MLLPYLEKTEKELAAKHENLGKPLR